jgi:hypothetical protein
MNKRKLPLGGGQIFRDVRLEGCVYVDKTMRVYEMASRYRAVFLARPRRFGKSLLCSTIEALFRGQKELFEGLALSKTDWSWNESPVIHLRLGAGDFTDDGIETLTSTLNRQLDIACDNYGIPAENGGGIPDKFAGVIFKLSKKLGRAVVIVDEYDNPLLSTINQPELNAKLRERLKGVYSVIKQNEEYIRFAFVTGVTKFSQISLFSGMNQPKDISMMPEYCDICGITQNELEECFAPEIADYAEKHGGRENYLGKLKDYYNGYFFTEKKLSVYNTYGILNHFDEGAKFVPYWSISGIPSIVPKYLETGGINIVEIEDAKLEASKFADYKDNTIALVPLLYQTGYLTISDYDEQTGFYKLDYPNTEVRKTFAAFLASHYSQAQTVFNVSASVKFVDALLAGDVDGFMNLLKWYLANVDYSLSSRITEYYVEFAVSNIINLLGLICKNEAHTANGRMDSVIEAGDYVYILEFKVDKPVENALTQIKEKDYALIYANSGKKIVKIGIIFSRKERNIVEWKTDTPGGAPKII